jgi:hypothetical protein
MTVQSPKPQHTDHPSFVYLAIGDYMAPNGEALIGEFIRGMSLV